MRGRESLTVGNARIVALCVGGYMILSLVSYLLGRIETIPPWLEWAGSILTYTFYLLGPAATLLAGASGWRLYAYETLLLAALIGSALWVRRVSEPVSGFLLVVACIAWLVCGLSVLVLGI
jgi:hypothetical protein